jgi:voltage-gated potassium channel
VKVKVLDRSFLGILRTTYGSVTSALRRAYRRVSRNFVLKLVIGVIIIGLASSTAVFFIEHSVTAGFKSIWDSFWWLVVVLTKAPGYAGLFPTTAGGRAITIILIIIGLSIIPLITAKIAAYMVTRQLREERGLEKIRSKEHTVICGWNEHIDTILEGIIARQEHPEVVLVNSLVPEKMSQALLKYKSIKPKFVYGDLTNESVLDLANVKQAATVIILTDIAQGDISSADERAILGTLAVKTMNQWARVCVEVTEPRAAPHVRRAGASEVIVHGEYDPFLITSAAMAEGIVLAARQLLSYQDKNCLQEKAIPAEFIGKKFGELTAYFREKQNAIVVGLFSKGKALHAEDVLSGDYSLIDDFIERKFKEAGKGYLGAQLEIPQANLNPRDDYIIRQNEVAIVIGE